MRPALFPRVVGAASDDFASSILTCGLAPDNDRILHTQKRPPAKVQSELLPASAHLVLNFRDAAPPSPRGALAYATPRRLPFRLMSRCLSSGM